jgi:general secretion pathway protein A
MMLSTIRRLQLPMPLAERFLPARLPFAPTLDQRPFFPSQSHMTVMNDVRRALRQREGLVVVTGASGTGKTLLCRTLLQELEPGVCASIVLDPRVTIDDLLLHILTDFGVISSPRQLAAAGAPTRHQLMRALQHFLASLIPVWGCAVLVIDEAQDLEPAVLEQLRLLLNFETDETKLLQIVLVGQPELNQRLGQQGRQLDERVARRCELAPLAASEVAAYIHHRLSAAQRPAQLADVIVLEPESAGAGMPGSCPTFTPWAIRAVARQSRGIPRAINVLCDRALEIAQVRGTRRIDWRIVRAASGGVPVKAPVRVRFRMATKAAMAAAAVALLAALGLGVRSWGADDPVPPAASPPPPFASLDAGVMLSKSVDVKALSGVDSFNIRVASFKTASSAAALAGELEAAGLPAFIRVEQGGIHRVIVGPYISYAEITAVQSRLASFGHPGSDVFIEDFERGSTPADGSDPGGLIARSQVLHR